MKTDVFFVVSRFNEPYEWVKSYTDNYLIYNKGNPEKDDLINNTDNVGANQRDIFHFIYKNYDNLPDVIAFVQAEPFEHCPKDVFNARVATKVLSALEYHGPRPSNDWERRDADGGYMEINNNWYINAVNVTHGQECRYGSFDEFMNKYFEDYEHLDWLKFAPGSQYVVPKENILNYPRRFWYLLMKELDGKVLPTEGHIIERALYYIFAGSYKLKKEYYGRTRKPRKSTIQTGDSQIDTSSQTVGEDRE